MPNDPVPLRPGGVHQTEIGGRLRDMAEEIRKNLSPSGDLDHVVNVALTLLHAAIGKEITLTDPRSSEEEVYRLWRD